MSAIDKLPSVTDGDPVSAGLIPSAVTAATIHFEDGAVQRFIADGTTVYTEGDRESHGEWYVDGEGRFCSFWPPSYRACYDLSWVAEDERPVGLRFAEQGRGSTFTGRYRYDEEKR